MPLKRFRNFFLGRKHAKNIAHNGPYETEVMRGPKGRVVAEQTGPTYSKEDVLRRARAIRKVSQKKQA